MDREAFVWWSYDQYTRGDIVFVVVVGGGGGAAAAAAVAVVVAVVVSAHFRLSVVFI